MQNAPLEAERGATFLLTVVIFALALNLRPAMAAVGPLLDLIEAATGMSSTTASLLTTLPVALIGLASCRYRAAASRQAVRASIARTLCSRFLARPRSLGWMRLPSASTLGASSGGSRP